MRLNLYLKLISKRVKILCEPKSLKIEAFTFKKKKTNYKQCRDEYQILYLNQKEFYYIMVVNSILKIQFMLALQL